MSIKIKDCFKLKEEHREFSFKCRFLIFFILLAVSAYFLHLGISGMGKPGQLKYIYLGFFCLGAARIFGILFPAEKKEKMIPPRRYEDEVKSVVNEVMNYEFTSKFIRELRCDNPMWSKEITDLAIEGLRHFLVTTAVFTYGEFGVPSYLVSRAWLKFTEQDDYYYISYMLVKRRLKCKGCDLGEYDLKLNANSKYSYATINTWLIQKELSKKYPKLVKKIDGIPKLFLIDEIASKMTFNDEDKFLIYNKEALKALEEQSKLVDKNKINSLDSYGLGGVVGSLSVTVAPPVSSSGSDWADFDSGGDGGGGDGGGGGGD